MQPTAVCCGQMNLTTMERNNSNAYHKHLPVVANSTLNYACALHSWRTSWTVITHRCQYKNNKAASVKAQGRFFSGHKDSYFLPQENERQVLRVKVIFSLVYLLWKWIKWSEIHASNQLTSTCHYCTFSRKEKYCETTTCTMESLLLQYVF